MLRYVNSAMLAAGLLSGALGCAHFLEGQAINRFAAALEDKDLGELKVQSSSRFERKALRLAEALDDFRVLSLPDGKASVVKVEKVSQDQRKVTVEVGQRKKKLLYRLVRDAESGKWVVDDIYVRQKKKGLVATRSVTEQMDLLLSVREFLEIWDKGDRQDTLATTTPRFRAVLAELPPVFLARLTRQLIGNRTDKSSVEKNAADASGDRKRTKSLIRPRAELNGDAAVVTLSRSTGRMLLHFRLLDGDWKLDDAAVESKGDDDHMPSIQKTATVLATASRFLTCYAAGDQTGLARTCTKKLYGESLAHADLQKVALPSVDDPRIDYMVKMAGRRAQFVVHAQRESVKISLTRQAVPEDAESPAPYLVEEVTLYETGGSGQEKRLSSMFTGQAIVRVFGEALAAGNLTILKKTATGDFNRRVWSRLDGKLLSRMPTGAMAGPAEVLASRYNGTVTEIDVRQAGRTATYVLHDRGGRVRVDDIRTAPAGEAGEQRLAGSLKSTLEAMIPVRRFAAAIAAADISTLQRTSSKDMNRLIWKQTRRIPSAAILAPRHINAPLTSIERRDGGIMVTLGDSEWGAKVLLVEEYTKYVVDDVQLVAGPLPAQRSELKKAMRFELANGGLTSNVRIVSGTQTGRQHRVTRPAAGPERSPARGVERAGRLSPIGRRPSTSPEPGDSPLPTIPAPPERLPDMQSTRSIVPDESAFDPPVDES